LQQSRHLEEDRHDDDDLGIDEKYQIPDELWKRMQPLIPPPPKKKKNKGQTRPSKDGRQESDECDLLRSEDRLPVERSPKIARSLEHGPRQIPGMEEGRQVYSRGCGREGGSSSTMKKGD
jgi:hypothetical protein